ncbi:MAG: YigZ family protein [Bacteroidota bacterium]|nr:YigZ family protein [Bacteroidota bacterium]
MEDRIIKYNTIKQPSQGLFKDKGSKFIAFAFHVESEEEVKKYQEKIRIEYHDARHHCYAYILGPDKKHYRANDDGEPSSSAGKPILGQIRSFELTNTLIIVIRYFGGVLLGVGGLINAYKTAAADALKSTTIIKKTLHDIFEMKFEYPDMNDVMRLIKEDNINMIDQKFDLSCSVTLKLDINNAEKILKKFKILDTVKVKFIETI